MSGDRYMPKWLKYNNNWKKKHTYRKDYHKTRVITLWGKERYIKSEWGRLQESTNILFLNVHDDHKLLV